VRWAFQPAFTGTAQLKKLASEESGTIEWYGDTAVLVDAMLSALRGLGRR
jgi:hypothetical protein